MREQLIIFLYPQMWSKIPSKSPSTSSFLCSIISSASSLQGQVSSSASALFLYLHSSDPGKQTIGVPVCLQLQIGVMQRGRKGIGSLLMQILVDSVTLSNQAAHFLFPTLGQPNVTTSMLSKSPVALISTQLSQARAPPKLIPVMISLLVWTCCLKPAITSVLIRAHISSHIFCTLQPLGASSSWIWKAQRTSCQRFLILAVYLKARTVYSSQTERIDLISTSFSSMTQEWMGMLLSSHPTQVQAIGSSILPTSKELTKAICSLKGRERAMQANANTKMSDFIIKQLYDGITTVAYIKAFLSLLLSFFTDNSQNFINLTIKISFI